jgi:hypothetical protein
VIWVRTRAAEATDRKTPHISYLLAPEGI